MKQSVTIATGLTIGWMVVAWALAQQPMPVATLMIDRPIHFAAPDGNDIEVPAGAYQLDHEAESRLRLTPSTGAPFLVIRAMATTHSETLESPVALSVVVGEAEQHIVLLLPDKSALDAVGSGSGITGRGISTGPLSSIQINQAMIGTQLQAPARPLGSPPLAIQDFPLANASLNGPAVRFQWHPGTGQPVPTRYELCIAEENQPCSSTTRAVVFRTLEDRAAAGTAQYELGVGLAPGTGSATQQGHTSITRPELDVSLPIRFQGKRLQWSVLACAPSTLLGGSSCSQTLPRPLTWSLPAPILQSPADQAGVDTFRPTFRWGYNHPASADYFLVCLAKPTQPCPTQAGTTANTVVAQVQVSVPNILLPTSYTPTADVSLLREGPLNWTVAACNAALGCQYQRTVRQIGLASPQAPVLLSPASGVVLSKTMRDSFGEFADPQRIQFSWQPVAGAISYKLCVAEDRDREFVDQAGTFVRYIYHVQACNNGPSTIADLPIPLIYWDYAESGYPSTWQVTACNLVEQCTSSTHRPIAFAIRPNSFYWLYPLIQNAKCTNCHGMESQNAKYQQHVAEGRFPQGTDPTNRTVCARCHSKSTGFEDEWRAPSKANLSDMSVALACRHSGGPGYGEPTGNDVLRHLVGDPLVQWGVNHMGGGITFSQWETMVRNWVGGRTLTTVECPRP